MTFGESINTCLKQKYADFNGRASRSEYWWFVLFQFLIYLVLMFATGGIMNYETGEMNGLGTVVFSLAVLALIVPSIAVSVRRLHDIDMIGWWYLVNLIPYVGGLIFLVLMVLPPKEPNRFGDAPLS